jgi:hypothetical protein
MFIPKDIEGMPDCYGATLDLVNGKQFKFEVVRHKLIDKIYDDKNQLIGARPEAYWEFIMKENDEIKCVPLSLGVLTLDSRWYKVCELRAKHEANTLS